MRRLGAAEESNFWPVYSDLALSTAFVLLLFLLLQMAENGRLLAERNFARERVQLTQRILHRDLEGVEGVVEVEENGNIQIVTLGADFLFPPDEARLTAVGDSLLKQISHILLANQRHYTRVAVEGHADAQRSRSFVRAGDLEGDHGNWRLSSERAIQVVQRLQRDGIDGAKLEAVGRSMYEPLDTIYRRHVPMPSVHEIAEADSSMARNRRMLVRIFYSEDAPVQ